LNSNTWSYKAFWKVVLPAVLSMLFISLYTIIDGIFISRYVGTKALAALNIVHPIYNLAFGIVIMLSVGGSALISIALGEGDKDKANNSFSLITIVIIVSSILLTIIGLSNFETILNILGLSDELYQYGSQYARILFIAVPFLSIKVSYEYFLRVDECVNLSLVVTIIGGLLNIILDYFFVARFGWGMKGAGYATLIGIAVSAFIGVYHFIRNSNHIRYIVPKMDGQFLRDASINGSSEMVTELSGGITAVLFNLTIMKYAGASGVAAISVLMYILFIFISISIGITMGVQPVISYNYGAQNYNLIRDLIKKSVTVLMSLSVITFILIQFFGIYPVQLFLKGDIETSKIAVNGLKIFSFALLLAGLNILGSGYFTAINNGKISAVISFARSIVFVIPGILLWPKIFLLNGVWITIPIAEVLTLFITFKFIKRDTIMNKQTDTIPVKHLKSISS